MPVSVFYSIALDPDIPMRHALRPFVAASLLAMPLMLAACKPMVVLAEPVTLRQQVSVEGPACPLPCGVVLSSASQVAKNPTAAAALAGREVDYSKNEVLVVCLGEHLTAGGSGHIESIRKKGGTLIVRASIVVPADASLREVKPLCLCVVAVVEKAALATVSKDGISTDMLEPTKVVVELK